MPKDRTEGGYKREKTITILKPDLRKAQYFNSIHTTNTTNNMSMESQK